MTSRLLRDALTPGSTDDTIRRYLAEAPDVIRVLVVVPEHAPPDWEPSWDVSDEGYPTPDELEAWAVALEALAEEL